MGVIANVEIVRKEMVKPSSPTPHHLKQLNLSFLDQIAPPPPVFITLVFFYEEANNQETFHGHCQLLRSSLSKALTYYYPLAGRLSTDKSCIDCNDAGALFVEAKVVHTDILHIILNPDMDDLEKLLPLGINTNGGEEDEEQVLLAVQINLMDCGGTAIGVQISHKIADGHSLVAFMNTWAAICRGDSEIVKPCFDLASLFPPTPDLSRFRSSGPIVITQEKTVTKRLVFDKRKLEILKHAAASDNGSLDDHPTRVEVVSAHIWKRFMEAVATKKPKSVGGTTSTREEDREIILCAVHAVNLRSRMNPSLPHHAFGNIWRPTIALPTTNEYRDLVGQLKNAIKSVDESFVKRLQNGDEQMQRSDSFVEAQSKGEIQFCLFTSWCRFPVYEVDYGWGQPVWVTTTISNAQKFSILLSTKSGDGLEAWISMLEEDASLFESDHFVISSGGQPSA